MHTATARWIGSAVMAGGAAALWHPIAGASILLLSTVAFAVFQWAAAQNRMRSVVSHRAISAALSTQGDVAFALFEGGRRPDHRSALIAEHLTGQDLVVPLDGDVAVVLARSGPIDRMIARLCRCQLALQQAGARSAPVGAIIPDPQDSSADVLSHASSALLIAKSRGPFDLECAARQPEPKISAASARADIIDTTSVLSPVVCASSGQVTGMLPMPTFGPQVGETLAQLTDRISNYPKAVTNLGGMIVVPVCSEIMLQYGTADAIALALDAAGVPPGQLVLCPDTPLFAGSDLRDLGVQLATPLLEPKDADLHADGVMWLPAAMTRTVASDPGRYGLLTECLRAAGERDIPVLALGLSDVEDAALLSQLGVTWLEGDAVRDAHFLNTATATDESMDSALALARLPKLCNPKNAHPNATPMPRIRHTRPIGRPDRRAGPA